jgi:hypothetical protein
MSTPDGMTAVGNDAGSAIGSSGSHRSPMANKLAIT